MGNTVNIDFKNLGGPTYIGRDKGEAARESFNLDELESSGSLEKVIVNIPPETYNINSSFFLGLFGASIRRAGSKDRFLAVFKFETHGKNYQVIKRSIERALIAKTGLSIK
ncbi:hypothetical protein [Vibrio harveyi]|uniref:hypothetical protein n=1 Tax=Vibrio harveyi TaxID=669 RepID=UPI0005395995|nr:hypothetical protein [Vibrio harveyi]AIV06834.1 hypothetical protein LA59_15830 [Vibrio harveyi]HEQ3589101.1 hypothetical protein [Vibrio harveyi]HEQ3597880.1 hypothetical protein [Vibrio harveyi]HEQ3610266.1 hypothetical protein [Vibrio harveyi]